MERRDLLKLGLSAAFIPTSGLADGGGGLDILEKKLWLVYHNEDEGEDEKITNFYIHYQSDYYRANLPNFAYFADQAANGRPTAAAILRGATRVGYVHAYYQDGFQGSLASGLYVAPSQMPAVNNAPVLIQANFDGMSYTSSGSIRTRAIGRRRAEKLPEPAEFQREQRVADLNLNGNTFVMDSSRYRFGIRFRY